MATILSDSGRVIPALYRLKVGEPLASMITAVVGRVSEEWSQQQISSFIARLTGVGAKNQWTYTLIWEDEAHGGILWRRLRHAASDHTLHAETIWTIKTGTRS